MLYFPQLSTGAVTQFPCTKQIRLRTIVTEAPDGSMVKLPDTGAGRVEWRLALSNLSAAEWASLAQLFEDTAGCAGSFVFFDPLGNLLSWSEELSATPWHKAPSTTIQPGSADPFGGTAATLITTGWIEQTVAAPAWYQYNLSVYGRSTGQCGLELYARSGTERLGARFSLNSVWRRLQFPCKPAQAAEAVTFGVSLETNAAVELFGFQAEAQVGASAYRKSGARCAVYANASFTDDVLEMTAEAPGAYSCVIGVRAPLD